MPAKTQYLSSPKQRALKITAGIIGGYVLAMAFQLAIGAWLTDKAPMIITSAYASFFLWVGLMIVAFLAKNGWRIWGIYLGMTAVFGVIIYLGMVQIPT
ncbi:MAG: hypothetical protein AAF960_09195 [Bacteroidota bacterium]